MTIIDDRESTLRYQGFEMGPRDNAAALDIDLKYIHNKYN